MVGKISFTRRSDGGWLTGIAGQVQDGASGGLGADCGGRAPLNLEHVVALVNDAI